MHILLIPSWYSTDRNPLRGSFIVEQAIALKEAGFQVGLLVPPSKIRSFHGVDEVLQYRRTHPLDFSIGTTSGLPVYRMNWWGWKASLLRKERLVIASELFNIYCNQRGSPDILHGHSILYGGYVAAGLGKMHHLPSVITEHASIFLSRGRILPDQEKCIRSTLKLTDRMVTVSSVLAKKIKDLAPNLSVGVIPNMVDTDLFSPPETKPAKSPFKFVAVGALRRIKGFPILIKAFCLAFRGQDAQLNLIGDGPMRRRLEKLVKKYDPHRQVVLCGSLPRPKVRDAIRDSHVLVSSSHQETFGITLIEALSCGKPVVATESGGPIEIVKPHNGQLVHVNNVYELCSALKDIRKDYDKYDSRKIRSDCVEKYSRKAVTNQLATVYRNVLAK